MRNIDSKTNCFKTDPACTNSNINEVISVILEIVNTEIVFILGTKFITERSVTPFATGAAWQFPPEYWLLILIEDDEKRHKIFQDYIEKKCADFSVVAPIIKQHSTFQQWLKKGDCFAQKVVKDCSVTYDKNKTIEEWKILTGSIIQSAAPKHSPLNLNLFEEYLAGANLYILRKQYRLAIFMFH